MSRSIVLPDLTYANRPPGYSVLVEIAMMKRPPATLPIKQALKLATVIDLVEKLLVFNDTGLLTLDKFHSKPSHYVTANM